ncbi:hypothetical protein BH787_gp31 [Gordonia phage GMA4]|uniref:hypothetical protein n=1 Tax=Gordonia phage GMA4 TaxID=1647471 RepID=UPI0006BC1408|nr:hypothetical protein BH787_gp31 [Gordonia phage GMA4]AKJ72317.1 hypothetical protein GMA4_42 [Gordonia phage GMA4]
MTDTTEAAKYRKKPVVIEAMQWDGTYDRADDLWEWTRHVVSRNNNGSPHAVATDFMVLGEDDAYEVFGCWDDDMELISGNEVEQRQAAGYSAVIRDRLHSTWINLRTGDWIIKGIEGEFYPCEASVFAATYEAVD